MASGDTSWMGVSASPTSTSTCLQSATCKAQHAERRAQRAERRARSLLLFSSTHDHTCRFTACSSVMAFKAEFLKLCLSACRRCTTWSTCGCHCARRPSGIHSLVLGSTRAGALVRVRVLVADVVITTGQTGQAIAWPWTRGRGRDRARLLGGHSVDHRYTGSG